MNLRDLQYLVALHDHQHFGKAAEICFVSQPALSMQIKKLEEFLGVTLLERNNKSVLFTDVGKIIVDRARQILNRVNEMRDVAQLHQDPHAAELKIGIIPTLAPYLLPHIIPKLSEKFPKVTLFLVEQQTAILLDQLKQGKIDAAFLAMPLAETGFTSMPIFQEEFMLSVPPSHAFAKRKSIKQDDLENNKLLLLEDGHCLRDQALALCHTLNATENSNFRATSLETLRHMVASGIGITLIPKLACKNNDGVAYIPFSNPKPFREIGLVWRTSAAKEVLLKDMTGFITKIMEKSAV